MTTTHTITMTADTIKQINRMTHRALVAQDAYGSELDAIDSLRNTLIVINQIIGLGGQWTSPPVDSEEGMIINGWNGHLQYGVVEHARKLPDIAADYANTGDWPLCYTYGVHS